LVRSAVLLSTSFCCRFAWRQTAVSTLQ
jgi:hypothetical protein